MADDEARPDWAVTSAGVVDGWLFDDLDTGLPEVLVLPLENPDLHDRETWDGLLEVESRCRSVTVGTLDGGRMGVLTAKLGAPPWR